MEPSTRRFLSSAFVMEVWLGFGALVSGIVVLVAIGNAWHLDERWWLLMVLSLGGVVVSASAPVTILSALAIALPWFGNRPSTSQHYALIVVMAVVLIGLYLRAWASPVVRESLSPLGMAAVLFGLVGLGSTSPYLLLETTQQLWTSLPTWNAWGPLFITLDGFLRAPETSAAYSVVSALLTMFSVSLALHVIQLRRRYPLLSYTLAWSLFVGFVGSIVVGLLDYYQHLDLRFLRALDPVVNVGDQQFRLQSTFGHSGWYAEYITLVIPFVLLILALRMRYPLRVALLILTLMVGEFALILTFQRGGWVAYPLTLLVVWAALYVFRRLETGDLNVVSALRQSALKIAISFPLTVVASLGIVWFLTTTNLLAPERSGTVAEYVDRFRDITRTSDRTEFFIAGAKLGLLSPFFGLGGESFGYMFPREFHASDGAYAHQANLPLHGTAHNVYFQTWAGKGVAGVLALLLVLGSLIVLPLRAVVTDRTLQARARLVLLACSTCGMAFLIYGNVQEIFYVFTLQVLFFLVLGVGGSVLPSQRISSRVHRGVGSIFGCLFLAHLVWNFGYPGILERQLSRMPLGGCYPSEEEPGGRRFQWCGPRGEIRVPVLVTENRRYASLSVRAAAMSTGNVVIRFSVDGASPQLVEVTPGKVASVEIELPNTLSDPAVVVSFHTAAFFIPAQRIIGSSDKRVLSFQLLG